MYVIDRGPPPVDLHPIDVTEANRPDAAAVLGVHAFREGLRSGPAGKYQCLALRCELREQNYPMDRVAKAHQHLFEAAGIPFNEGAELDHELRALNRAQAGELLRRLKGCA